MPSVVITAVGGSTAGNDFTLTCTAENLIDNLVDMPELQWLSTGISSSSVNTLDLPFNPLRTSVFLCVSGHSLLWASISTAKPFSI